MEYKELQKQYWRNHLWARGCFVAATGNITDEIIVQYIQNQEIEEFQHADNFSVGDKL